MTCDLEDNTKRIRCPACRPLLLLICFATMLGSAIPIGYCIGVVNTPAEFIKSWCEDSLFAVYGVRLTDGQINLLWASIVSIFLIGGICGSFAGAWCCDKYGRKGCLVISAVLMVIAGILFQLCRIAKSVEMLIIGRLMAGIAAALIFTAQPMYLMEIAPTELRASVGVFMGIGVTTGILVGQVFSLYEVFGNESLWQYALSFYAVFVLLSFLPSYWYPESPRWLYVVKRDPAAAESALRKLRGVGSQDVIASELAEMELSIKNSESVSKASFGSVLRDPELLLPLFLVCALQAFQMLSGINAIFYYSVTIFTKAGFTSEQAVWMNLGTGFLNVCCSALCPITMAKFNRRPCMLLSTAGCAVSLFGMGFALKFIDYADWVAVLCIIFIAAFIVSFQLGLAPIPFFLGSEIFEVAPRPVAMAMGSLFSWLANFAMGMSFPLLQGVWGSFVFLPCAVFCFACFLMSWRYLPESRGREPIELKPLMRNGFKSKVK